MATKTEALATIAPLPARPSKEEEIQFFRAIVESIPADSYLSSLFTNAAEYVERVIRDDFALAPYVETIEEAHRGRTAAAALVRENEKLDATIKNLETVNAAVETEIAELNKAYHDLYVDNHRLEAENKVFRLEAELSAACEVKETIARNLANARAALAEA